ncbi:fasciclin domain-containing protein [Micromonospora siamensis]|uniref:Uncaracterized surface protein containing fasciclin (FAS1) repeats n=1 Tax=Micromonospora siamensis TaxID=299152 RepID=A0A1C5K083_9ACTN|nr:fasciclin domain-containing protein [Micromonospora siamensis]SCG76177.1 Uncaracterized surface protein containing fasciclin (FAS1) repeats [Micromonospora siamensis]
MRPMKFTAVAIAATVSLGLTACGGESDGNDPATPANPPMTSAAPEMSTSAPAAMADGQFGPGCAAVPTDASNPGSFEAMAKVPVATAASGNPLLSTLVTAVKQANLVDSLNSAPAVTVFAPTNDAFGKIPKADLDKVLADKKMLTDVLTYHVVEGKLTPEQLAGSHKTLQGGEVTVSGGGTEFTVNGTSMVVCGNVQTANAIVYIVDSVLMPKS